MFILRIFTAPGIHINHETASAWRSSFQSFCAEVEETHKKSHSNWHRCRIASTNTYRRRASFYNSVAYYLQVFGRRQLLIRTFTYTTVYTECPRSNVPDFGRVFLMLKYTDITQNTYIQSSTVKEIMPEKSGGFLRFQILHPAQLMCCAIALMTLRVECSVNCACVTVSCLHRSWKNQYFHTAEYSCAM